VDVQLTAIPAALRSRGTENDYGPDRAALEDAPLPEHVDLRRPWHTVRDQGHTASCVGWTVSETLRWHLVEQGRLKPDEPLSARHIWMAAKETDKRTDYPSTFLEEDGTSLKAGLDVVRKFGAVLESELPWTGVLAAGSPDAYYASAGDRKVLAYFNLFDAPDRFHEWRKWLHQNGPVLVLLKVDRNLWNAQLTAFEADTADGSHAAALFGYGPDHFLLRSSWGPGWGEQGYARMSLDYAAAAVIESYGVMV
jgi:hypothetical protein